MFEVKHVERYTIPLGGGVSLYEGTTVSELIAALKKLPAGGIVSHDYGGQNSLFVTFENDPIRV